MMMLIWTIAAAVILGSIHYYLYLRLVRDPSWPQISNLWGGLFIGALAVFLPVSMMLRQVWPAGWNQSVAWAGFIWMGFMFLFLVWIFSGDVVRITTLLGIHVSGGELDDERRLFLSRVVGGAAFLFAGGGGMLALHQGLSGFKIKKVEVSLPRLPAAMRGLSIAQISDLHVGPTIGRKIVEKLVQQANELKPDIIAITGDLVDGTVKDLAHAIEPLGNLKAKHGIFFVTGNHEYYSGADSWIEELTRLGIRVLRNERVQIGEGEDSFDLAGIDDHTAHRYSDSHGVDFEKIVEGRDTNRELILLAHQPRDIHAAEKAGVGLQLSGHTHGGQIWPFGFLVKLVQPYLAGLYQHSPQIQIYVSRGTGYWGPPMRLGADAELTHLVLS